MNEPLTTSVAWTREFEFTLSPSEPEAGREAEVKVKVRCAGCWGGLVLRGKEENGAVTSLTCRVCNRKFAGEAANDEYHRMLKKALGDVWRISWGFPPPRADGPFVGKLFPHLPRQTEDEVRERIASHIEPDDAGKWLTRRDFPLGTAAILYLQARLLMTTVTDLYATPDEAVVNFHTAKPVDDPRQNVHDLYRRLGTTMTRGMMAAFACELLLKAISLTVKNEARKTHDLLCLYDHLSDVSKARLEFDYPDIPNVMDEGRHRFGSWRYFETGKKEALTAIIDTSLEQSLGKAARVLLDEAEMVGLQGGVDMKARRDVTDHGETKMAHYKFEAAVKGSENPPKLD